MIDTYRLSALPSAGKLFIGLFTTLILLVCVWVVWIYTAETGKIDTTDLPAYLSEDQRSRITGGSSGDTLIADSALSQSKDNERIYDSSGKSKLRSNLGMAHTHINGQSLLFFALGLVFLFTSASMKAKKIALIIFAASVLVHAIALTGEGFHWLFDDLLSLSGVVMLAVMLYMSLLIYIDLGRKRTG